MTVKNVIKMRITKQAETLGGNGRTDDDKESNEQNNKTSTLPLEDDKVSVDSKKTVELLELETGKGFCECVSDHVVSGTIEESDVLLRNGLSNKVKVNVNMFSATVKGGILRETYHTLVIAIKGCR